MLFWGIFGALTMRAVFIFAGSALISRFWWLLLIFGVFLVYTGIKVLRHRNDEGQHGDARCRAAAQDHAGQRRARRAEVLHPHQRQAGGDAAVRGLVVVEITDVIFAVDSVPAILAVSNEPYLVFASNMFAILGLRALYFLLANAKERFHYLSTRSAGS